MYGRDLDDNLSEIRDEVGVGVCPQYDVLFPDLTVREHLRLFAGLKGVPSKHVDSAVSSVIATVGLTEKVGGYSMRCGMVVRSRAVCMCAHSLRAWCAIWTRG